MHAERWKRVEQIYQRVLAYPPELRAAVLDETCQADTGLRRELESLLSAREEAGSFLSRGHLNEYLSELGSGPLAPGLTLDHYKILAKTGAGSMGDVYRAVDTRLERQVALKILPAHFTNDAGRVARFQLEAKAASALNHPNIITIYEIGKAEGTWFIAAEFVEGLTLRERLAAGKLPLAEALDITISCAGALAAAHKKGIVHRDIKPENIMLRSDGVVKLVDFGLARISQAGKLSGPHVTEAGSILGTPRYMSPEQARGQIPGEQTDIFSLGAVLYEMLAGRPAFAQASTVEVLAALLDSQPAGLGGPLDGAVFKALEKDLDARYQTMEEFARDLRLADPRTRVTQPRRRALPLAYLLVIASAVLLLAGSSWFFFAHRQSALSEHDTILLADFRNQTGEQAFDPALKEGLAVQLEQSPLLNIFPDARVRETLRLMNRPLDQPITPEIAREICQRQGLKALIAGAIARLGSHYAITLEAVDSRRGDTLARIQVEAENKETVLKALSRGASQLRGKLGESLASIQKYDALLERTTSSLEALRAYSLGYHERRRGRSLAAISFFQRAVELDPQFAYAYADMATLYRNSRQLDLAAEFTAKAYAARDRVSEREKLRITAAYFEFITGELEKVIETLKIYQQIYPRDALPYNNLGVAYASIGQNEPAVTEAREAMRLDSEAATRYSSLASELIHLNRFSEAKEICEKAFEKKLDSIAIRHALYRVAFVAGDQSGMDRQVRWAAGKPNEYVTFGWQASTTSYAGQWRRSQEHFRSAIDAAIHNDAAEVGALYVSEAALTAAAVGECGEARAAAVRALSIHEMAVSVPRAMLALAICGDAGRARLSLDELSRRYPKHTIINGIWLPAVRAALEMNRKNEPSVIEFLKPATRYEAAAAFWPQYLRGQAYLRLQRGSESAAEFTKILNHRGQAPESVLYPLARLGLARAAALQGQLAKARESYQEFFSIWKQADSDLPQLVAARKEFARLGSIR